MKNTVIALSVLTGILGGAMGASWAGGQAKGLSSPFHVLPCWNCGPRR
ncbi:hypothetical protein Brsp02_00649 [Brucella sp. NBRC 113783]